VKDIVIPRYIETAVPTERSTASRARPLFENLSTDFLLGLGIPKDWLADVQAADEDTFFELAEHLPIEAAEALLEVATNAPMPAAPAAPSQRSIQTADFDGAFLDLDLEAPSPVAAAESEAAVGRDQALSRALDHPDAQRRF